MLENAPFGGSELSSKQVSNEVDLHDQNNPFLSPETSGFEGEQFDTDAEQMRREYLSHEASVKSIGFLYLIGGAIGVLYCVVGLFSLIGFIFSDEFQAGNVGPAEIGVVFVVGLIMVGMTWLQIWAGLGLRRLNPAVRTATTVLSAIGLLGFPVGTLISAYILWLIHSAKGKVIFSPEYQKVIQQTPHIKYKTSVVVWIFLGLLLLLVLLGTIAIVLEGGS